mgnify:CR=1 FL=1
MEVKDVSDGYARNFLFARKLAVPADEAAMKLKAQMEKKDAETISGYQKLLERLKSDGLEFKVKAGTKGEVFGSVNAEQIKKALHVKGFGETEVELSQPLRSLGEHKIEVNFGKGVRGEARVSLVPQR